MLSICIVNWNTKNLLRECLASIEAFPPLHEQVQVIVVDNASTDGTADMVRTEFPTTILIANYHNASYAAGNNQALAAATGDYMLLLNPDVQLLPGTLTHALDYLDKHTDADIIGIRQIGADGKTQASVRSFPEPGPVAYEALGLSRLLPKSERFGAYRMTYFDYNEPSEVDQPMGTFLLFRREVYAKIGGMDEAFPLFFNDVDWCYRAKLAGFRIFYTPDAEIIHYGGSGTRQAAKPAVIRESHRSMIRFYEKHYASRYKGPSMAWMKAAIKAGEALRVAMAPRGPKIIRPPKRARKLLSPPPPRITPDE
ncbi:MAG TPA: glycosyltransferase family 2 protein [Capsulimonadaceae bacterium]|jgi:hypothetical protein